MSGRTVTWILDRHTGQVTVEGLDAAALRTLAGDLLPPPQAVNCAQPLAPPPLPAVGAQLAADEQSLRVVRLYHGSVVEGPGRRSVVQTGGCVHHCSGCYAVETHPLDAGVLLPVSTVVTALLDPGGAPLLQPDGLLVLLRAVKAAGQHVTLYTGYSQTALARRDDANIPAILALTDLLIDGRYVAALADGAGEWRGSRNQQVIDLAARRRSGQTIHAG